MKTAQTVTPLSTTPKEIIPNPAVLLGDSLSGTAGWVKENTALLVVHGIGNQLPMETIDQFGRGLIMQYMENSPGAQFAVEHIVQEKGTDNPNRSWFDNVIRIRKQGDPNYIDLYEYYWANYTQEKANFSDISDWLKGVVRGAKKYYKRNMQLAEDCKDESVFNYHKVQYSWRYFLFLTFINYFILIANMLWEFLLKVFPFLKSGPKNYVDSVMRDIANVVGDIVVYNNTDPKCKYYDTRRQILDGAVSAIQYLIEKEENDTLAYPAIIIAGHSLGSQVSYDALNRLNFLAANGKLKNYTKDGLCQTASSKGTHIKQQLRGYITFGSPLDKIAFFLRENVPEEQFLRQQLLNNFLAFKQRNWIPRPATYNKDNLYFPIINHATVRMLEDIKWRNYHDKNDYVSGGLDYYQNLTNVDCNFKSGTWFAFTHSNYWNHKPFYADIIREFLASPD